MKERPILFSAHMVRAILDGRKTQTRRALNPQPVGGIQYHPCAPHSAINGNGDSLVCKFGKKGDRLWVRESWSTHSVFDDKKPSELINVNSYHYWADGEKQTGKKRQPIHMPRWASRIDLEITGVRVERLQDISEADAIAEGVDREKEAAERGATWYDKPKRAYRFLWESINGQGSWDKNPWVWIIEFKRIEK